MPGWAEALVIHETRSGLFGKQHAAIKMQRRAHALRVV
jgi:hypothetical protein